MNLNLHLESILCSVFLLIIQQHLCWGKNFNFMHMFLRRGGTHFLSDAEAVLLKEAIYQLLFPFI
jgi:hypothetical protein